jgi:hypothetical protein
VRRAAVFDNAVAEALVHTYIHTYRDGGETYLISRDRVNKVSYVGDSS